MPGSLPPLEVTPFPDGRPAPPLARWLCPAGPPRACRVRAAGAAVASIPGRYGVTHVLEGPEALGLVDVGSAADVPALRRAVAALRKPVAWVIASHLHFDHVLGVEGACRAFGARLCLGRVAHAHVVSGRRLRGVLPDAALHFFPTWLWQGLPLFSRLDWPVLGRVGTPGSRNAFRCPLGPALRVGQPVPDLPGWEALDTPGHADEAICLYHAGAGFLVAGDSVRNYRGGEWNPLLTDRRDYQESVSRLLRLPVQAVFPGHGATLTGEGVLERLRRW